MTVAGRRAAAMATAMAATAAERAVLVRRGGGREGDGGGPGRMTAGLSPQEEEFRWLLHDEVHAVLRQLQDILKVPRPRPPPVPACRAPVPGAAPGALPAVHLESSRGAPADGCPVVPQPPWGSGQASFEAVPFNLRSEGPRDCDLSQVLNLSGPPLMQKGE